MSAISFVIKVTDQCNLYCGYCYYYAGENASLRTRKFPDAGRRLQALGMKIANASCMDMYDRVSLVLHGGEPLLSRQEDLVSLIDPVAHAYGKRTHIALQTNGLLVNCDWIQFFIDYRVTLGFSIDAGRSYHDERRPLGNGKGSYDSAVAGLRAVQNSAYATSLGSPGIISVFDERVSASDYLTHFIDELNVCDFDILFPDEAFGSVDEYRRLTPLYAQFVKDMWGEYLRRNDPSIRFRFIERIVAGFSRSRSERSMSKTDSMFLAIDLTGNVYFEDGLRYAFSLDDMVVGNWMEEDLGLIVRRATDQLAKRMAIPDSCRSCENLSHCGGGELSYRYSPLTKRFDTYALCEATKAVSDGLRSVIAA